MVLDEARVQMTFGLWVPIDDRPHAHLKSSCKSTPARRLLLSGSKLNGVASASTQGHDCDILKSTCRLP